MRDIIVELEAAETILTTILKHKIVSLDDMEVVRDQLRQRIVLMRNARKDKK